MKTENGASALQEIIAKMISGDREAILQGLSHPGAIYRMNAIGQVYLNNMRDAEIIEKLMELKMDDVKLNGYTAGDFAVAALHNFGIEKYEGDKRHLKELIESKFGFLSH